MGSKSLIIENLELDDISIEDLLKQRENDFLNCEDLNIFYSYPYFSLGDFDYQFRLFTEEDSIVLEEVKCNDTCDDEANSVVVISEVARIEITKGLQLIENGCDLKSGKKIEIFTDILKYDLHEGDENESKRYLVNNKNIVLLELYKNFY